MDKEKLILSIPLTKEQKIMAAVLEDFLIQHEVWPENKDYLGFKKALLTAIAVHNDIEKYFDEILKKENKNNEQ